MEGKKMDMKEQEKDSEEGGECGQKGLKQGNETMC